MIRFKLVGLLLLRLLLVDKKKHWKIGIDCILYNIGEHIRDATNELMSATSFFSRKTPID